MGTTHGSATEIDSEPPEQPEGYPSDAPQDKWGHDEGGQHAHDAPEDVLKRPNLLILLMMICHI